MKLYDYAASANGYKVRLLLAQLARPYDLVPVDIFRGEAATDVFLARSPAGQIPLLETDDGAFLAESNAILVYLAEGSPWLPENALLRAKVLQWLFFEQNQIEPNLGTARYWNLTGRVSNRRAEWESRRDRGARALAVLERHLATSAFAVGTACTIADIALYAYTHRAGEADVALEPFPAVRAWIGRMEAMPRFFPGPDPYSPSAMVV